MNKQEAKDFIKQQLPDYLLSKGVNIEKPFHCLNPDHPDKNPSMSYDKKRNKVKCFSCGADYDTFDLIGVEYSLRDNKDIFQKAYEVFGLNSGEDKQNTHKYIHINTYTQTQEQEQEPDYTDFFNAAHERIKQTDYPQRRGLSEDVINRFNLGYIESWKSPNATGNVPTSPRLIIPTSKHSYLARDTRPELTEIQKNYSKFKVGKVRIFNAEALQTAVKPIFVVEGEIDALSIIEAGGEAIATGSASNRRALLKLLESQKPSQTLIIAMDNDERGKEAAQELINGLKALDIPFYRLNPFGEYKDANEALQADRNALIATVGEAEHIEDEAKEIARRQYLKNSAASRLENFYNAMFVDTPSIPTGFKALDEALGDGLFEGLYILGAISSLGKTTIINQMADQIASTGRDVLIFSLEMAANELIAKSISRHTLQISQEKRLDARNAKTSRGITTAKRRERYSQQEQDLIDDAINAYYEYAARLYIHEGVGDIGVNQVRDVINQHLLFTGNTPVIIIDYLQILAPYSERMTDKQNIDKAVLELKRISRDFKTPVLCVSSFNRANYKEAVTMEAFKESGAIEYSSDVLIGLQLEGAGSKDFDATAKKAENPRAIELVILKNRNGRTGAKVSFKYYPMFNCFIEC